jgi:hypothetical protein
MRGLLVGITCVVVAACASQKAGSSGGDEPSGGRGAVESAKINVLVPDTPNPIVRLPQRLAQEIGVTQNTPATMAYLEDLARTCRSSDCQAAVQLCEQHTKACILAPTAE